jgi:hypothetical protein
MNSTLFDSGYPVVDRSTLERYAECPAQARYIDTGAVKTVGRAAIVGSAVHDAISKTIQTYLELQGGLSPTDIRDTLESNLRSSRADVQPEAIKAFKATTWGFSHYLANIHAGNILKFDGGEAGQSGQIAYEFDDLRLTVTSEIDLLHATKSPELLRELDWKSGFKVHNDETTADSFQFQLHAFLILQNYPDIEAVNISVWNTRMGKRAWGVEFSRRDLRAIEARIRGAAEEYLKWREMPPELCETWPTTEKCRICPAASMCPAADRDVSEIAKDPAAYITKIHVLETRLKAMEKVANAYVDKHGEIEGTGGIYYGIEKPPSRKPLKALYTRAGSVDAEAS